MNQPHIPDQSPEPGSTTYAREAVFRHGEAEPVDAVGKVEAHGIDVIPADERHGRPLSLFPFWLGSNIIFTYMLFGGILIELGLPLGAALTIAVLGNLAWVLVGLMSVPGPRTGTATMVVSRAQYGFRGNKISCFFSWLANVGYEGVDFAIAALACYSLAGYAGWHLNTLAKALILGVIIAVSFAIGLYGHATILAFQKLFAWALGIAAVVFFAFLLPHVKLSYHPATPLHGMALTAAIMIAISVVLSGPLSYPIGSDYSRYLPADTSARRVVWYTAVGGYIPSVALTVIGILAATAINASDFTTSVRSVVPGWFYPVFLLIVIFGVICNSILSVYSSGLSLQALGVPLARSRTVWVDVVIGTALAVYGVLIATNFLTTLENFLLWSIYWYAPFFGVYMAELALTRGHYDGHELHRLGGRYWYDRGYRWRGVAALAAGMIFSALTSDTPYFVGPLSSHVLSGGDLSAIGGLLVGAGTYWLLCVRPARRQAAGQLTGPGRDDVQAETGA
ncbi:MAG TPA: cytosine permease [Streptosporangiaceae bacterium]|nr:cytosine permease [Streptosporangiaceae bacterium]